MPEYPEHEKLMKISDKSQAIGEFLEWLGFEKGAVLHRWVEDEFDELCTGDLYHSCIDGKRAWGDEPDQASSIPCKVCDGTGRVTKRFVGWADVGRTQDLLAEFFEIDQDKLEQEKRAMLERMRNA